MQAVGVGAHGGACGCAYGFRVMEKGTRPPALLETGAVRAHNDQIQNSIAIDNVPIELSDSDSD